MALPTIRVLEHVHDAAAGVYRIAFAQIIEPAEDALTEELPDGSTIETKPAQPEQLGQTQTVVWGDEDERWFTQQGKRRAIGTIAEEQRAEVRDALSEHVAEARRAEQAAQAAVTELPGVGEEL